MVISKSLIQGFPVSRTECTCSMWGFQQVDPDSWADEMGRLMIPWANYICDANSLHFYMYGLIPVVVSFGTWIPFFICISWSSWIQGTHLTWGEVDSWLSWTQKDHESCCCLAAITSMCPWCPWCVWVFGKLYCSWLQRILMCQLENSARFPKIFTQDFSSQYL